MRIWICIQWAGEDGRGGAEYMIGVRDRHQGGNTADFGCSRRRSTILPPEFLSLADDLTKRYEPF